MEITPGIRAKTIVTDAIEVAEARAKIAEQQMNIIHDRELRIKQIMDEVDRRIQHMDGPIRISNEMRELGIAEQVWNKVQLCEVSRKFNASLRDEDDVDYGDVERWID